ncbi:ABC transporter substrate-binding protein [Pseudonocardia acaciae]|uniref:ABC transporter substrate-binding protein n=1 Tax=Pseudonocardia acaciae TaxID=551276 RepID=UPI003CCB7BC2
MRVVTSLVLTIFALAGCAGGRPSDPDRPNAATGSYPFTIKNCGTDVTVRAAPKRVVTMNQTAAEILIHLGVDDRIVGSGYEIYQVPDEIAERYEKLPILSAHGQEITHEKLLEAQPDLVYSSFGSFLTAPHSGDREELHKLGVPTYVTEFDCTEHVAVPGANFPMMYEEYRRLARIFDVPAAGEKLVTEQQTMIDKALAAVKKRDRPLKVMWFYSMWGGTPWAAGPGGLPQNVSDLVGVQNIFADASTKMAEVSWDAVAARNPDVIILADLTRGEPNDLAREKIDLLKKDPLTSKLGAVAADRFIIVPGAQMDPGYGSAYLVPALVDGLNRLP